MTGKGPEEDPAEFLLSSEEYHDCHLTVGDPETGDVERIGVSSVNLVAHSSVFRDMLMKSDLADPSGHNTHIQDVSPDTFKLMLRYIYGAELPEMTPEEAANLAFCADKYNIQRLVGKVAERLMPTSVENVFTALICVAYISCPSLEMRVSEIIQRQTDTVVKNPKFLQLDENCLLFIVKQTTLNISELELWNSVILWAENRVKSHPQKALRDCLDNILQHIRLLSLTPNEIVEHVLPKKVLSSEEIVDLSLAMSERVDLQSPGLCKVTEMRGVYRHETRIEMEPQRKVKSYIYLTERGNGCFSYHLEEFEPKNYSTFTVKPKKDIEMNTLTLKGIEIEANNRKSIVPFDVTCSITMYGSSNGFVNETETITLCRDTAAVPNENIVLEIKKSNNEPLILKAKQTYNFEIHISPAFPVYKRFYYADSSKKYDESAEHNNYFTIKFEDPFHVFEIKYSVFE